LNNGEEIRKRNPEKIQKKYGKNTEKVRKKYGKSTEKNYLYIKGA
jgi:hypothetical protein